MVEDIVNTNSNNNPHQHYQQAKLSSVQIDRLQTENNYIIEGLVQWDNTLRQGYSDARTKIQKWAANLEELHKAGIYKEPISTINRYIRQELIKRGAYNLVSFAASVLDIKYKNAEHSAEVAQGMNQMREQRVASAGIPIPDEGSGNDVPIDQEQEIASKLDPDVPSSIPYLSANDAASRAYEKQLEQESLIPTVPQHLLGRSFSSLTRDEKRELTESKIRHKQFLREQLLEENRRCKELEQACKQENIPIVVKADTDLGDGSDLDDEIIRTEAPQSKITEFSEEVRKLGETYIDISKLIVKYPPDEVDIPRFTEAIRTVRYVLSSFSDLKYRKCWFDWFKIGLDCHDYGKHAAATMNYTITQRGQKRTLTREQVGDKYELAFLTAIKLGQSVPDFQAFIEWMQKKPEIFSADRSVRMEDKLSRKA